jgi:hypothetical protein
MGKPPALPTWGLVLALILAGTASWTWLAGPAIAPCGALAEPDGKPGTDCLKPSSKPSAARRDLLNDTRASASSAIDKVVGPEGQGQTSHMRASASSAFDNVVGSEGQDQTSHMRASASSAFDHVVGSEAQGQTSLANKLIALRDRAKALAAMASQQASLRPQPDQHSSLGSGSGPQPPPPSVVSSARIPMPSRDQTGGPIPSPDQTGGPIPSPDQTGAPVPREDPPGKPLQKQDPPGGPSPFGKVMVKHGP